MELGFLWTLGGTLMGVAVTWGVLKTKVATLEAAVKALQTFDQEYESKAATKADLSAAEARISENLRKDIELALLKYENENSGRKR